MSASSAELTTRSSSGNGASPPWLAARPLRVGLGLALGLALFVDDASATALGSLATSVGLFAAVAALLVAKGWQAHLTVGAVSTAGGMLALAAGAGIFWRSRTLVPARTPTIACPPPRFEFEPSCVDLLPDPLPGGVDAGQFMAELHSHFVRIQAAWDLGQRESLTALTTPQMLDELCAEFPHHAGVPNRTDVVTLHAKLLAFEELDAAQVVCVEYSGMIRESAESGAAPFRELWMLVRAKEEAAGWRLARQQALM